MFHRTVLSPSLLLSLLLLLVTVPLATGSMIYTDRSAWETATPGFTNIDFEGITSTSASYGNAAGLTVGAVQFQGIVPSPASYQLWVVNPVSDPSHDFGSGTVLKGPMYYENGTPREILVTLPGGVTSIAVDLMTVGTFVEDFSIVLSTAEGWTVQTLPFPQRKFFGATTDTAISSVHLWLASGVSYSTFPVIDNFGYGTAGAPPLGGGGDPAETPETATVLMVGTGLIMVWRMRRRRLSAFRL